MSNIKYLAFDVHLATIAFCIMDSLGKILSKGILATSAQDIRDFLRGIRGTVYLSFEQGPQAAWLFDICKPLVTSILVCNPRHNRLILTGNKSDLIDAQKLAQLHRMRSLKPVFQTEHSLRPLKHLVLGYEALVTDTVRIKNRIKSLFRGRAIRSSGESIYKPETHNLWLTKITDGGLRHRVDSLFQELDALMPIRTKTEETLLAESKRYPAVKYLKSIPTLGPIRSAQIIAIVGTPHRFRTKRQYFPYCGLSVITRSTSDFLVTDNVIHRNRRKPLPRGLTRNYNRILKRVYKSAAKQASSHPLFIQSFQAMIAAGTKPELAQLNLARKIAAISLSVWKNEQRFDPRKLSSTVLGVTQDQKKKESTSLNKKTLT